MEEFTVKLADVPVRVRCRFAASKSFLRDYLTDEEPTFAVEPTPSDWERIQEGFDRMDEAVGIPPHQRTDEFLENNAIHALLAEGFVEHNVLLMHGSALCMDGDGYLFVAKSGTGKSTHARLWRESFGDRVWMVNDDKPLLKIEETSVTVWGTPWDGKHRLSQNAYAPLKAIVKLDRSQQNHIEPVDNTDAFPILVRHAYASRNPITMARIVQLENHLLSAVDFYALGCNMQLDTALVAWRGINS